MDLGMLKRVNIREIWEHEALTFTPWLAKNLDFLGRELGLDFSAEDIETEVSVGDFNIDIVAKDTDGRTVIIENQLERTDHDHLGKCITYAAGKAASVVIWVAKDARAEHQKAIEWLNSVSSEQVKFFLIQIEAWRIGDSKPAPKFSIVEKPNDWARAVSAKHSDLQLKQRSFWEDVVSYGKEHSQHVKSWRTPAHQHWFDISIGMTRAHLSLAANSRKRTVSIDVYIDNGIKQENKDFFDYLHDHRESIENQLGKLVWARLNDKKSCMIGLSAKLDYLDEKEKAQAVEWLIEQADRFIKVFEPYKDFSPGRPEEVED